MPLSRSGVGLLGPHASNEATQPDMTCRQAFAAGKALEACSARRSLTLTPNVRVPPAHSGSAGRPSAHSRSDQVAAGVSKEMAGRHRRPPKWQGERMTALTVPEEKEGRVH